MSQAIDERRHGQRRKIGGISTWAISTPLAIPAKITKPKPSANAIATGKPAAISLNIHPADTTITVTIVRSMPPHAGAENAQNGHALQQ